MNCGIIAVFMGIVLNIIGNFFEHCSKVYWVKIEHNRPRLNHGEL